jgi:REP element-mobilizing transposase RayT
MARHLRLEVPGAIYHVTCRMLGDDQAAQSRLFRDVKDRERFLDRLAERVEDYRIRLFLFVLMSNHFHLVFETPEANCSKFMQALCTAYTVYYNLRHSRHGHLLDGRFKARLVEGDKYLLTLSRYVHLNPIEVGALKGRPTEERIEALRAYEWSSYPSYIGKCKPLSFVAYGPLLSQMHGPERRWPRRYRDFVESGLDDADSGYDSDGADFRAEMQHSPRSIGSDGFRTWIDELYQQRLARHARPEDVAFRHTAAPLPSDQVLAILSELLDVDVADFSRRLHGSPLRAVAARLLIRYAGLSQRDVGNLLHIGSGAAVCNQLHRLPEKLAQDDRLRRLVNEAEEQLVTAKSKNHVDGRSRGRGAR